MTATPKHKRRKVKFQERYKSAPAANAGQWNIPRPKGIAKNLWEVMLRPHATGKTLVFRQGPRISSSNLRNRVMIHGKSRPVTPKARNNAALNPSIRNEGLRRMYKMIFRNVKSSNSINSLSKRLESLRLKQKKAMA
jgi:hypothetical protein